MSTTRPPLVSVGIPAYNRPRELERAVRSVLVQSHGELEILVSDDASPDADVASVGRDLARLDPRVRFVRQAENLGHAGNYQWVLESARGPYFMWLSDDDWIDADYVRACLAVLREERGVCLACGLARYYRDGVHVIDERPIDLRCARAGIRVVRYFARVSVNGPLFGLARREDMLRVGFPDVIGGDWRFVSALAAKGRIRTLGSVHIHRSVTGLGSDERALAESFGLRGLTARQHHLLVAARTWRDIAARDPAYTSLGSIGRVSTATLAALLVIARFPGLALARSLLSRLGAQAVEDHVTAWVRTCERSSGAG